MIILSKRGCCHSCNSKIGQIFRNSCRNFRYGKEETCLFKPIDKQQVDIISAQKLYQNVLKVRKRLNQIFHSSLFVPTQMHELGKLWRSLSCDEFSSTQETKKVKWRLIIQVSLPAVWYYTLKTALKKKIKLIYYL